MLCLLGFDGPTRQWRETKTSVLNGEDATTLKSAKAPKTHSGDKLRVAKQYITAFADKHKNYQPVDNKNSTDVNKSEVIIPFESTQSFHRCVSLILLQLFCPLFEHMILKRL